MIYFIVALQKEAAPLIAKFKLKQKKAPFPFFIRDDMGLVISGMGKCLSAAATSFIASTGEHAVFLNVGLAGAKDLSIGATYYAHKIYDTGQNKAFYPSLLPDHPSVELHCLDGASTDYQDGIAFDMESSGFFAAAERFSTRECIHCLKIISDNEMTPFSKDRVSSLVEGAMDTIQEAASQLAELGKEARIIHALPSHYDSIARRWHFSSCQQELLTRLLLRYEALGLQESLWSEEFESLADGDAVLKHLQRTMR